MTFVSLSIERKKNIFKIKILIFNNQIEINLNYTNVKILTYIQLNIFSLRCLKNTNI